MIAEPKKHSLLLQAWDLLVIFTAFFSAIEIPVRLSFGLKSYGLVLVLDWMITAVFLADLFRHSYRIRNRGFDFGLSVADSRSRFQWFWAAVDFLPVVPFFILPFAAPFQLLRVLKLARVGERMRKWRRSEAHNTNLVRLIFFVIWLAVLSHWLACGWLKLRGLDPGLDDFSNYLGALYWCVTTLTTVGYGDVVPNTNLERLYTMATMIMGVGVYGYVIGSVASLLAKIDPARTRHRELVERVTAFMRYRQVPSRLQRRILAYYEYLWTKRLGYNEAAALEALPPSLMTEVALFLNQEIIEKVPLFEGAGEEFIRSVAVKMRPCIYLPGDYIIRASEIGEEMYFISQGIVEVIASDGETVLAKLKSGDFFGELALLYDQPRTASVKAVDYCDLYALSKGAFESVLARHPDVAARIKSIASKRYRGVSK